MIIAPPATDPGKWWDTRLTKSMVRIYCDPKKIGAPLLTRRDPVDNRLVDCQLLFPRNHALVRAAAGRLAYRELGIEIVMRGSSPVVARAAPGGELDKAPITTALAPAKPAITSQATRAGDFIFTAGVMPLDLELGTLPPGGIEAQTHQAMRNLRALLEAAGSSLGGLVQVTIYLRDWADFAEMNAAYASYLSPPYPSRACVEVSHIGDDAALEIVAVALAGPAQTPLPR